MQKLFQALTACRYIAIYGGTRFNVDAVVVDDGFMLLVDAFTNWLDSPPPSDYDPPLRSRRGGKVGSERLLTLCSQVSGDLLRALHYALVQVE